MLGSAEMQQMHLALAERYFLEAMHLVEQYSGPQSISAALCAPMLSHICYERGRLDEAEALLLVDLMPVVDAVVVFDSVLIAYRVLVRIAAAHSNLAHAYALLDRAQAIGQTDCRCAPRTGHGSILRKAGSRKGPRVSHSSISLRLLFARLRSPCHWKSRDTGRSARPVWRWRRTGQKTPLTR